MQQLTIMLRTKIATASIVTTILDQVALTLASHVRTIMATAMIDIHHNLVCGLHDSSFLLSAFFDAFAIIFTSYIFIGIYLVSPILNVVVRLISTPPKPSFTSFRDVTQVSVTFIKD